MMTLRVGTGLGGWLLPFVLSATAGAATRSLVDLRVDAGAAEADLHTLGGGREMQVWFLPEHLVDRPLVRPDGETGV